MEESYLFSHTLSGVTMTIKSISLDGAKGILHKIVKDFRDWENYK